MGTTTPVRGLYKPAHAEIGWDALVNGNFDNLDATADKSYVDTQLTTKADLTYVNTQLATKQNSLGYTAENTANKDQASGYAGLDANGFLSPAESVVTPSNHTSTYTLVLADRGKLVTMTASSYVFLNLPNPGANLFPSGWWCEYMNLGTAPILLRSPSAVVNGVSSSPQILPKNGGMVWTDGSVWYVMPNGPYDASSTGTGQGYFLGGMGYNNVAAGAGTQVSSVANQVNLYMFVLPAPIIVRKVTIVVTAGASSSTMGVGLYDVATGNQLLDAEFTPTAAATVSANVVGTNVWIPAGTLWFAYGCSSTAVSCNAITIPNSTLLNRNANRYQMKSANAYSAGFMPATLGAISVGTGSPIFALFES